MTSTVQYTETPGLSLRTHPLNLDAVAALRPTIERCAAGMEQQGRLSDEVIEGLGAAGVFGLMVPAVLGGAEAHPETVIKVLGDLSYADGATGWTSMAMVTATAVAGAFFGEEAVKTIFEGPRGYACAGTTQPRGTAEKVPDGYRIGGTYSFGSGTSHANWLLCGFVYSDEAAAPGSKPTLSMGMASSETVEFLGNWDVMGLKATGSYDFRVRQHVVPADFVAHMTDVEAQRGGSLYRMGFKSLAALGHGSFPLGVAQRALDELKELSHRKKQVPSGIMADRPTFQRDFAEATAAVRSARSYMIAAFSRLYDAAERGAVDLELRADARLAASSAVKMGTEVTQFAYISAGSDSLRNGNKIQRCYRDMHAGSQHVVTAEQSVIDAGAATLGATGAPINL